MMVVMIYSQADLQCYHEYATKNLYHMKFMCAIHMENLCY